MTDNQIIQMHDYEGNNQYPVTLASLVYDEDGETVGKKLALLLDWFEWGDEEETSVKTKYPFWSEKQLSAGGIGEEGEGGEGGIGTITGIYVNGVPYNEPDEFGMLTLPNYPTSLEWANINGRPTHLSQFTDDVVAGHYLPLSGGIIGDSWSGGTEIRRKDSNNGYASLIFSQADGTILGRFGFSGVDRPIFVTQSGAYNPLLHSGNVGDYSVKRTDAIDLSQTNLSAVGYGTTTSGWLIYGPAIAIGHPNGYTMLLQQRTDNNIIYVNRKNPDGIAGDWKAIAFTDSDITGNAATATKLQTPHTIWGQSFDGTGNVDGDLSGFTSLIMYGSTYGIYKGSNFSSLPPENALVYYATSHYFHCDNGSYSMILNSYGNVTIGGSDLAGTDAKLYVRGITLITSSDGLYGVKIASEGNTIDAYTNYSETANLYINHNTNGNVYIVTGGGNVGIGTTNPQCRLDVNGKARFEAIDETNHIAHYDSNSGYFVGLRRDGLGINEGGMLLYVYGENPISLYTKGSERMRINGDGNVGVGTSSPEYKLEVNGNGHFRSMLYMSDWLWFYSEGIYIHSSGIAWHDAMGNNRYGLFGFDYDTITLYQNTVLDSAKSLTIGSAVLSWDYVNNALKIEGNVYTTGQLSAGGVGTEVQKVFDIAAATSATEADASYTKTLTHNLNTYDLAVVVYEVEEISQSDETTTEKLTQVLADVTLTDENKVTVYFASRKINKKYRIVIIG